MDSPRIYLRPRGDDGFDLVCGTCGRHQPLIPNRPILPQIRCFLEQHQHDQT
jgi:hypothetical protein